MKEGTVVIAGHGVTSCNTKWIIAQPLHDEAHQLVGEFLGQAADLYEDVEVLELLLMNTHFGDERFPAYQALPNLATPLRIEELRGCSYCRKMFHEKRSPQKLKVCAGCHHVSYCDGKCQKKDWK